MSSNSSPNGDEIKELASKIQQFLSHQVESNSNLNEAAKESLTVATECIEQAYDIQRKNASNSLLDIYKASKSAPNQQQFNPTNNNQQAPTDPAQFITSIASTIMNQVAPDLMSSFGGATAATATSGQQPAPERTSTSDRNSEATAAAPPQSNTVPKTRKKVTEAEALAAESFKNQGNDCMKQERFREAHDYYSRAIEIDNNNAIYYSNRAAASAKLGDHQAALRDCQESIEIDPNYSKAYGRMGLAYVSMDNHQKAKEAYMKAVELDPGNESYRTNLAIAEEKLAETQNAGGANGPAGGVGGPGGNMVNMLRSMMNNPEVMSMAMRSLQDPRIQSMFGLGGGPPGGAGSAPR